MSKAEFAAGLDRGKVTGLRVDVAFPDGSTRSFEIETKAEIGGLVFDDGLVREFIQTRAEAGDPDWAEAVRIWADEDVPWQARPSFLLLPRVDPARCGPGNCPAAKTGQCIGGGQCDE